MTRLAGVVLSFVALTAPMSAQRAGAPGKALEIYVVDTEGGKAATRGTAT
jgi:hypothetical protein